MSSETWLSFPRSERLEKWTVELTISILSAQQEENCSGIASWEQHKPIITDENVGPIEIKVDHGQTPKILSQQ
jgi:hypothetical protein